jgi:uncharacterized protein
MSAALVIERYADADAFLATAESWLLDAEAENNLLLGIALGRRGRPPTDPPSYWASVRDANGVVGCACRTPPHPVVLSRMPPRAVASLSEDVGAVYSSLSGVNGPTAGAEALAVVWIARHGGQWRTRFRLRLHELTRVSFEGPLAPGALHKAGNADLALAREWMDEYVRDTGIAPLAPDLTQQLIGRGRLNFWLDGGGPRAMVASTRETRSGCAINTVYTPPQFRRRGYATAAVATLSETLLGTGRRFCCLYTDLANPTSNSIYAKIGYRPIRDDMEIAFESI